MWRCLNDLFGYCTGDPVPFTKEGQESTFGFDGTAHQVKVFITACKSDQQSCGHYQAFSDTLAKQPNSAVVV